MSFICSVCHQTAPQGTRCTLVKVKTKVIQHPFRSAAHREKREDGKWEYFADEGGKGVQTAKEIKVCVRCIDTVQAAKPTELKEAASAGT